MTPCKGQSSACTGADLRLVKLFLRRDPRLVCSACRAVWQAHGVSFEVIEVDTRPAWLSRDLARDFTGRAA